MNQVSMATPENPELDQTSESSNPNVAEWLPPLIGRGVAVFMRDPNGRLTARQEILLEHLKPLIRHGASLARSRVYVDRSVVLATRADGERTPALTAVTNRILTGKVGILVVVGPHTPLRTTDPQIQYLAETLAGVYAGLMVDRELYDTTRSVDHVFLRLRPRIREFEALQRRIKVGRTAQVNPTQKGR